MNILYYADTRRGTVDSLRAANLQSIMTELLGNGEQTKLDLVRSTGLSMSTVSDCMNRLRCAQLLDMTGIGSSSGGRKPMNYAIRADYASLIGVYANAASMQVSLADMTGREIHYRDVRPSGEKPLHTLYHAIETGMEAAGNRIAAIGIGCEGVIDPMQGIVISDPTFAWSSVHLKELVERRFGVQTFVDHGANAVCLHEQLIGPARSLENFVCALSRFPECAVAVVEGRQLRGSGFLAGRGAWDTGMLTSFMRFADIHVLLTDREDLEIDCAHIAPTGAYDNVALACCLMAEARWFSSIYDLSKGDNNP